MCTERTQWAVRAWESEHQVLVGYGGHCQAELQPVNPRQMGLGKDCCDFGKLQLHRDANAEIMSNIKEAAAFLEGQHPVCPPGEPDRRLQCSRGGGSAA